jgi:uncharacterized protein
MSGSWIQTYTGRAINPLDPSPADICIEDIAHALSLLCRFGGHVREFYSVAEHSVRASYEVAPEHALWALLHDSSEAYMVDFPRPLKHSTVGKEYREVENHLMKVICERFGLPKDEPTEVKRADNALLNTEQRDLMGPQVHPWNSNDLAEPLSNIIAPWSSRVAEVFFLRRFYALTSPESWARNLEFACSRA